MTQNTDNLAALQAQEQALATRYAEFQAQGLKLDLTRGKPGSDQLDLSNPLDGLLNGQYQAENTDLRNYGGLDGLAAAKALGALLLNIPAENVLVGGNSSLTLMYHYLLHAHLFGLRGAGSAWNREGDVKFLCPVPGYDRHFGICEALGIRMLSVPMTDEGPDMDRVETLVRQDPAIKGLWCVPKYSNPTGCTYSDAVVARIAALGKIAGSGFRVMYDNAYSVHDLTDTPPQLASIFQACRDQGTEDSVVQFASTSKMTFAGAGVAFVGTSQANLAAFKTHLAVATIGPDKINQQRHVLWLKDAETIRQLMRQHAAFVKPKFECVQRVLEQGLGNRNMGHWTDPDGGYFISFYTHPGLATEVVRLAGEAGVKLTPAGAAFPYGKDPDDQHIRLSPTFPRVEELEQAMEVFVTCVQLARLRQQLHESR
jgi:DNA-binding transcriptional MocR family regulator